MTKKNAAPVIPVRKTGRVSSKLITVDFSNRKPISKATAQEESTASNNLSHYIPPIDPDVVVRFYEQNPFHARAILLKALCVAGIGYDILPIDTKAEDYFGDLEYLKLKNFLDFPNSDGEIFENILVSWMIERYNYGHGYIEVVSTIAGELAEIFNLRAYNCFPKSHYNKLYYIQKVDGGKVVWFKPLGSEATVPSVSNQKELSEVVAIKNYNLKTKHFGFPEWYPATADLVLDRSVIECRIREFDNNLMIQFMIICEGGDIDSEGLTMVQKFLAKNYKGVSNAGKVLYLNSDNPDVKIRVERLDKDVKEVGYIRTREQTRDFILVSHGVASVLLGAKTQGQLGGTTEIKDLFKIFNETVIKPDKKSTHAVLNNLFRKKLGITKFKIELKEMTIDTLSEMVDYVSKMKSAGIIDNNEARSEFGYEAVEEESPEPDSIEKRISKISSELRELKKALSAA